MRQVELTVHYDRQYVPVQRVTVWVTSRVGKVSDLWQGLGTWTQLQIQVIDPHFLAVISDETKTV